MANVTVPYHTSHSDPSNFGKEGLDPQHIAMFNGSTGGRQAASFPQRTIDSGLSFHPTPEALRSTLGESGPSINPLHPEILTGIIAELWSPSTSHGALGQALAVATDAPPSISAPSDPPITISPPLDLDNIPEPPEPPEGSAMEARFAAREAASKEAAKAAKPTAKREESKPPSK